MRGFGRDLLLVAGIIVTGSIVVGLPVALFDLAWPWTGVLAVAYGVLAVRLVFGPSRRHSA